MKISEEYQGNFFVSFYQYKGECAVVRRDSFEEFIEDKTARERAGYMLLSVFGNVNGNFLDKAVHFANKCKNSNNLPQRIELSDILNA